MTNKQLQAIEKFTKKSMTKTLDPEHDYDHVNRVRKNTLKIVDILKVNDQIDRNLFQAAGLLHDILFIKHKFNLVTYFKEPIYLKQMLPGILKQFNLTHEEEHLLSDAIYHHTHAYPFRRLNKHRSLYAQILQDADQIEMFKEDRILKLKEVGKDSLLYKILSMLSGFFVKRVKRNFHKYINNPIILEHFEEYRSK